ncbi:MAG: hypothetical protein JNN08_16695 [Bryobacterales bacterium]|nr:hypothetical protein [Bryobacterales bacterium]
MRRRILSLIAAGFALAIASLAADVTGKWTAMVPGRNGDQETTFTLKQDGDKLTGSMTSPRGERQISEGKVTGDSISFKVETQRGKFTYTGTVSGSEIKFKRQGDQGEPREFTAKKSVS